MLKRVTYYSVCGRHEEYESQAVARWLSEFNGNKRFITSKLNCYHNLEGFHTPIDEESEGYDTSLEDLVSKSDIQGEKKQIKIEVHPGKRKKAFHFCQANHRSRLQHRKCHEDYKVITTKLTPYVYRVE